MNAKTLTLSALTLAVLLVLASCEAQPGNLTNGSTPGKSMTSNALVTVTPAGTQAIQPLPPPRTEADMAAYNGAMELKDISYCEKIKDETYKTECKTTLSDQLALSSALEKTDATLCAKLSTADKQEACRTNIAVRIQAQSQETQFLNSIAESNKKAQEITDSGDYTKCKELPDPNAVSDCEYNILVNKALADKDISWCTKISSKDTIETCKALYKEYNP